MRPDRREFLKMGIGAAVAAVMAPKCLAEEQAPRALAAGEHLFIDDFLIAAQTNVRRVIETPKRLPEPVVRADPDKCYQPYVAVVRDAQSRQFRLWYNAAAEGTPSHIGYLESPDGVEFIRPHRELADPSGVKVGVGASVIDEGRGFADPTRRFKLAWENDGLFTAFSPDGLAWTATSDKPVLTGIGDIIAISRDPIRNSYLLTCKVNSRPEDGYKGKTPNAKEGTRRLVGQSISDDCIHWSPAQRIIAADAQDEGITEFYSIANVIARGGLLIGMLKVLRDDLAAETGGETKGIGYTVLAWTRDGQTWQRDREPFLPRNPQRGTWDRAMTWGDCLLPVDDEVFCYFGGYARGHKVERYKERQIGLAKMKRDRFVARAAGTEGGRLRTPAVKLDAAEMKVNAHVDGELRMRVCDASGAAIEGFDAADCTPVSGDAIQHAVRWKKPLAELRGRPVSLEFSLKDARLYAFTLA